ncbi:MULTISPECIES: DUF7718 family protein [Proteiniphilum]|uniref:DUF7718 family protein n=1 Tax=Proteiniphilum TaxID=294702 RepID=UPI0003681336|nr:MULTISPECIES: hypothetical protein [Proteiniphilum]SEA32165.1 hypothetical protein SAMN05216331_13434 [Porphyromonadaceae bacterium KH3R12]SFK94800.1 hypothetical protein SAMN05216357_10946 [Porphyromonadaceae bacterium KH3CP3RA]
MKTVEFTSYLDFQKLNRLRVRLVIDNGILLDVMYQYEAFLQGEWLAIVRYDCAHGFFHRDIMLPNGDKEKKAIEMDNLKAASRYAEQDLKDRWQWYKESYIKKMNRRK